MVYWYPCSECKKVVDEFETQYGEDLLCSTCRKDISPRKLAFLADKHARQEARKVQVEKEDEEFFTKLIVAFLVGLAFVGFWVFVLFLAM